MATKRYTEKQVREMLAKTRATTAEIEALFENVSKKIRIGCEDIRYNGKTKCFQFYDTWVGAWLSWHDFTRDEMHAAHHAVNVLCLSGSELRKLDALTDDFDA